MVTTSSTISTLAPASIAKPRPSSKVPVGRSTKIASLPSARPFHAPDGDAASCRGHDNVDRLPEVARRLRRERDREPSGAFGVHQHARALEVIFFVTPRRQGKCPCWSGSIGSARGAEFGQGFIIGQLWRNCSFCPVRHFPHPGDQVYSSKICLPPAITYYRRDAWAKRQARSACAARSAPPLAAATRVQALAAGDEPSMGVTEQRAALRYPCRGRAKPFPVAAGLSLRRGQCRPARQRPRPARGQAPHCNATAHGRYGASSHRRWPLSGHAGRSPGEPGQHCAEASDATYVPMKPTPELNSQLTQASICSRGSADRRRAYWFNRIIPALYPL